MDILAKIEAQFVKSDAGLENSPDNALIENKNNMLCVERLNKISDDLANVLQSISLATLAGQSAKMQRDYLKFVIVDLVVEIKKQTLEELQRMASPPMIIGNLNLTEENLRDIRQSGAMKWVDKDVDQST